MAKVLFWIVVVFAVLLVLRLLNLASAKRRRDASGSRPTDGASANAMVRCVRCGLFVPKAEAKRDPAGFVCADGRCLERR